MKKIIISMCLICCVSGGHAAYITTTDDCPTLDSNCLGWSLKTGYSTLTDACVCTGCPDGYSLSSQYTCKYVGTSGGGSTTYELCSSTNQCRTFSVTIDGQIYCMSASSFTSENCNQSTGVAASTLASQYCSDYKGVDGYGARCIVVGCQTGYVVNDTYTACTSTGYTCGAGYYGTATGANNAGCTACTSAPTGATYTTAGSCAWECSSGYYKSGTSTCARCPSSSTSGYYANSALTSYTYGTTASSGATSITECYLSPGTFYDATGTIELTGNCAYSN